MDAKLFIPSLADITNQTAEPWVYEGRFAPWFIDNPHRAKYRGHWAPDGAQYFSGNTDPALIASNNVQEGDLWQDTANNSIMKIRVNGDWLSASGFWLRGAYLASTTGFLSCSTSGNASTGNNYGASGTYGVVLRFSI